MKIKSFRRYFMRENGIKCRPFDELSLGFLQFLQYEKMYSQSSLNFYKLKIKRLKSFLVSKDILYYTSDVGLKFYIAYLDENSISINQQKAITTFIKRFNDYSFGGKYIIQHAKNIELLPKNYELILNDFCTKCYEIGNKEITVKTKDSFLRRFLKDCIKLGCPCIQKLNVAHVMKACIRVKNKESWAIIREFLKFLATNGTTKTDMSTLVPHYKKPFKIPVTYSKKEILKFENIIDRTTNIGKRDYAMLLLATRLGMRSGDIVNIKFENLDFKNDKISFFQQKTGDELVLPLLPEIKKALENYILYGRPKVSTCNIFIRQNAPYEGITTSVLRFVTTKYFKLAGINITGKRHGLHVFRSSLASSMINDSVPYEAVRKILGHSNLKSINHYAKLNIEILRQCAIEVPKPSGKFKEFLQGGESL